MEKTKKSLTGYLFILLAGTLWGFGSFFVAKLGQMGAPAKVTAFTGQTFALVLILIVLLIKEGPKGLRISLKGLFYSMILGIFTKAIFKFSLDSAIISVGSATASVLLYLAPVFTVIMSIIFFREKISGLQWFAVALNIIACVLMLTGGNFRELHFEGIGLLLGVFAGFLYALNTILGKVATSGDGPITMAFYMILFSSITLTIYTKPWEFHQVWSNPTFLFWAIFTAIVTGGTANIFFLMGLSYPVEASKVTVVASIEVVVASLSGIFLLGENINGISVFGIFVLISSILIMNWPQKTKLSTKEY